jgi:hypothetical protein
MPTIVYLIHGMGCGTADGNPPPDGSDWSQSIVDAFTWLCTTFGLAKPVRVNPSDTKPPKPTAGVSPADACWVVPISYYSIFDEFRRSSAARATLAKGITSALSDGDITRLAGNDFLWANCLDVLLWWADDVQTNNRTTATIVDAIAKVNQLALSVPGATTRRIVVSHSLGTAASTASLLELATKAVWTNGTGFEAWFTLANVAPFLLEPEEVYGEGVVPDGDASVIHPHMYNVHNECDPVPWLLWWRAFSPDRAGSTLDEWKNAAAHGFFEDIETVDVAGLAAKDLSISSVHGFMNYLLSPDVALRVATHVRGSGFSPQELATINYGKQWSALPHLMCTKNKKAYDQLRDAVESFKKSGPIKAGSNPRVDWISRLLDAAELLLSYEGKC